MQSPEAPDAISNCIQSSETGLQAALEALRINDWQQAAELARQVLDIAHALPLAVLVLGVARQQLGHPDALDTLAHAVALAPQDPQFHFNYAVTLAEHAQPELAMVEYRACLNLDPDFRDALWNYGEMLRLRSHFDRALACFDRLLLLEGGMRPKMAHRMAVCCAHLGLADRAETLFQQELADARHPGDPQTHWEYALFLLGRGHFAQAWPHYARRFDAGEIISVFKAELPYAEWTGQFQPGAALIVHGEQGAGDEILFAAFLPELLDQAQACGMCVVIACRPALVSLFEASFPSAPVLPHEVQHPADVRDVVAGCTAVWQVPMGNLPLWIDKPKPAAYLCPHPQDVALIWDALPPAAPGTRKVGVAWAANPYVPQVNRQARNVPPQLINAYAGQVQGAQFFSLHTTEHRAALAHLADVPIADMSHLLTDFSKTAALMRAMDLVVSVCTSTANLSGALGLPTRVLLQKHACWRWHRDTAWYPHITDYRQTIAGDWSEPVQNLFADLNFNTHFSTTKD
jgi:Tfp pilus assembly protein PilF